MQEDLSIPEGYDARAVNLARAIRKRESEGNYHAIGDNGTSKGAYQWQEGTWQAHAKEAGVDPNDFSPKNQDNVAYAIIKKRIDSGMSLPEIAAEWNSGTSTGWENKRGTTIINGKPIKYDVPAYVNDVNNYYQELKEKTQGITPQTNYTASQTSETPTNTPVVTQTPKSENILSSIVSGITDPMTQFGGSILGKVSEYAGKAGKAFGDYTGLSSIGNSELGQQVNSSLVQNPSVGEHQLTGLTGNAVDKFGYRNNQELSNVDTAKQIAGNALQLGSNLIPEAKAFKGAGLLSKIGKGALTGAKAGAVYGAGQQLNEGGNTGDVAFGTITGGTLGGLTGGVLGGAVQAFTPKRIKLNQKQTEVYNNIYKELSGLESSVNSPLSKSSKKASERGFDVKDNVIKSNLLKNAVDENGTIHTTQPDGPLEQYQAFIRPQEAVISDALAKENARIPFSEVRSKLTEKINDSGLKGGAKIRALNEMEQDLQGYLLDATDKNGNKLTEIQDPNQAYINLADIHAAKVDKYGNINYMNPESQKSGKAIAKGLKELVESNSSSEVKKLNDELAQHYATMGYLEKLNGRKVEGGRLGKYVAQMVGTTIGSHFGPLGGLIGGEVSRKIKGIQLANKLGGSETVGEGLKMSSAMQRQIKKNAIKGLVP